MAKIIIVGCGIGGLTFILKHQGDNEITVYEAKDRESLGFPWRDTIKLSSFTDNGLDIPHFALEKKKRFYTTYPDAKGKIVQRKSIETTRAEIDRKDFIEYLIKLCEHKAKFVFGCQVKSIRFEDEIAKGIILQDGTEINADLIIDASGGFSNLRSSLPINERDFQPNSLQTMHYYRAYFLSNQSVPVPEYDCVYLKALGDNAIAWVRTASNDQIDVFIGRIGGLDEKFINKTINYLSERNPRLTLNSVFVRTGKLALRYPLSHIVFNNVALIGDSAYMSVPMTGSGMDNAIFAGTLLADVINDINDDNYSIAKLWKYQSKYFRELGANMYVADIMLKYGMNLEDQDVNWFFDEMLDASTSIKDLKRKLRGVIERKELTKSGLSLLRRIILAKGLATLIPIVYEENLANSWAERYDAIINEFVAM